MKEGASTELDVWIRQLLDAGFVTLRETGSTWTGAYTDGSAVAQLTLRDRRVSLALQQRENARLEWGARVDEKTLGQLVADRLDFQPRSLVPPETLEIESAFAYLGGDLGFVRTLGALEDDVLLLRYRREHGWVCEIAWTRWPAALEVLLRSSDGRTIVRQQRNLHRWDEHDGVYRYAAPRSQWFSIQAESVKQELVTALARPSGDT